MATSKLQRLVSGLLSTHLGAYTIRENIRPDWLTSKDGTRLELDFLIEELDIAIEVQGIQHYVFTPYFQKDENDFRKRVEYDERKRQLCLQAGIHLIEIDTAEEAHAIIPMLKPPKYVPGEIIAEVEALHRKQAIALAHAVWTMKKSKEYKRYKKALKRHVHTRNKAKVAPSKELSQKMQRTGHSRGALGDNAYKVLFNAYVEYMSRPE